jgi:hypothetical protein
MTRRLGRAQIQLLPEKCAECASRRYKIEKKHVVFLERLFDSGKEMLLRVLQV